MDTLKQLFGDSLVGKKKLTTRETTLTRLVTVKRNKSHCFRRLFLFEFAIWQRELNKKCCRLKEDNKFGRRGASEMIYYPGIFL